MTDMLISVNRFSVILSSALTISNLMKTVVLIVLMICTQYTYAQMCPGGGVNFGGAVTFDPAWIYGCNTGTSCNGGVNFDNRISCQPITLMDACAPAPSCGTIGINASNIWFKFFATSTTATISCFQNTSFVIGVQAFNGGPACGSLVEIGCALAGGPSSGVVLNLSGLTPGHLYYFRIFGSANPVSQRTGLYCFCGTTGLSDFVLPVVLTSFEAGQTSNGTKLSWTTASENNSQSFEVERSTDGISYHPIAHIPAMGVSFSPHQYTYTDPVTNGLKYYRLRQVGNDGRHSYSPVLTVQTAEQELFAVSYSASSKELKATVAGNDQLTVLNLLGQPIKSFQAARGVNKINLSALSNGVYLLHSKQQNLVRRFCICN